jgi:AraC-like DNA-binding protein
MLNIKTFWFPLSYNFILKLICDFAYILACILLVFKNRKLPNYQKIDNTSKLFINFFIMLFLFQTLFNISTAVEFIFSKDKALLDLHNGMHYLNISSLAMLLSIFFFPNMLYGIWQTSRIIIDTNINNLKNLDFDGGEKVEQSFKLIGEKLELYFLGKPYLYAGFNMSTIATVTQISYPQLALFYSVYLNTRFSNWKNSVRIEHAANLLQNGEANNLTLEAISLQCGYRTRANFITSFKKHKGVNPSVYLKRLSTT